MAAKALTIGLDAVRSASVKKYFAKFSTLPPKGIVVSSTQAVPGPATFETLVNAVTAANAEEIVLVTHGFPDGTGLFLPLANRGNAPVGPKVKFTHLKTLAAIAKRTPPNPTEPERELLGLLEDDIKELIAAMKKVQAKKIKLIEFRGCNLGRNAESLKQFREFFGAAMMGAPNLHSFFGDFPAKAGASVMGNHTTSHSGTTHSFPETFGTKKCICCVGINAERKPENGHIVADDKATIDKWIEKMFSPSVKIGSDDTLPIHGLWLIPPLPPIDVNDPNSIFVQPDPPRPFFPLEVDGQGKNEYKARTVYSQ